MRLGKNRSIVFAVLFVGLGIVIIIIKWSELLRF